MSTLLLGRGTSVSKRFTKRSHTLKKTRTTAVPTSQLCNCSLFSYRPAPKQYFCSPHLFLDGADGQWFKALEPRDQPTLECGTLEANVGGGCVQGRQHEALSVSHFLSA